MSVALATRWLHPEASAERIVDLAHELDLKHFFASRLPDQPAAAGATLREHGITMCAVAASMQVSIAQPHPSAFTTAFERAARAASRLRADHMVIDSSRLEAGLAERLEEAETQGDEPARAALRAARREVAEAAAECAVRALHAGLQGNLPLAIRNGAGWSSLLGFEETGWLLDELPGLRLFFDAARAERQHRLSQGPAPEAWAARDAGRCAGVFIHGLGAALEGGRHPEDDGPAWGSLAEALPRRVPWVLDLSGDLTRKEVADALGYARAVLS